MYGGCPLCPLYPLLTKASSHAISFKAFRWGIRVKKNSLGPRDQKRISRAEQRGLWTRQRETVLYSLSLSLKTLDTGILLWAFFTLEIEVDYPSETSRCTDAPPPPHRHPFSDFFLGEGAAVHRLSETDNPYPNYRSKLTDKVRWMVHSKLKPFHFLLSI